MKRDNAKKLLFYPPENACLVFSWVGDCYSVTDLFFTLQKMPVLFLVGWVIVTALLTYRAFRARRNADNLLASGIKTQGVVIGHQFQRIKGRYQETDYPIIRFTTATGQVVEVAKMTQVPLLNKFETIPILYEAANPQNLVFDSEPGSALPYLLPSGMWVAAGIATLLLMLNK